MDQFIQGPSKRDVAGMKAALGQVQTGQVVSALYKTARFGNFLLTGQVHATVFDDLMVGGLNLAAAAKKSKDSEALQRQPDKDVRAFPAEFTGAFEAQPVDALQISHGDLVVAAFAQEPYGDFVVTGVVTAADDDERYLMVGPWILATAQGPAQRLTALSLVSGAGSHRAPVPPRRSMVDVAELA